MTSIEGGCLCGAIRYRVEGEPFAAGVCHCRDCQAVSGGFGDAAIAFPAEAVTVTRGAPKTYTRAGDSGRDVHRQFCPDCGVHLITWASGHPDFRGVKAGTLDDPAAFRVGYHIWTGSAQPWHRIEPGVPAFEGNPTF